MKRSEWEDLISNGNGTQIGLGTVLGYQIYAIKDDMGHHKNIKTLPAYVCQITEEDLPSVNKHGIEKITYPMYICIPSKLVYRPNTLSTLELQILGMIAIDCHLRDVSELEFETLTNLEFWVGPHNKGSLIDLKPTIQSYLDIINSK